MTAIENRRQAELRPKSENQRKFVLDDAPALVLATVSDARAALVGHDEDDILAMIEEGFLPFAWDISLKPGKMARELRIFPACIEHYKKTGGSSPFAATFESVIELLLRFPQPSTLSLSEIENRKSKIENPSPFLFGTTVKLLLNCGATHLINLVDAKALRELKGTGYRRGPNGSPCITRDSFIAFLTERLEGGL